MAADESIPAGGSPPAIDRAALLSLLFRTLGLAYLGYLLFYYSTGLAGPTVLAVQMVPASLGLLCLNDLRQGHWYPRLPPLWQTVLAAAQVLVAATAAIYLHLEFDAIRINRMGAWNLPDHLAGGAIVVLILEYTRRKYFPVFVVNLVLILYAVYGYAVPGIFQHGGLDWTRISSVLSLEMSTGVFERLPQLGLTLIGAFVLLLAALQAFGCIDSILKASSRLATKSPRLLPQAAVLGSFGVGAVSGSGAANAAATGAATIPMLVRSGFPPARAAAVETASSLGGQLMPPLMGISAFLMADLMGVSYFEVVARGFAPALIYFLGVALAVYLLSARFQLGKVLIEAPPVTGADRFRIAAYGGTILALVCLMGYWHLPAMVAAQRLFYALLLFLALVFLAESWKSRTSIPATLLSPCRQLVERFSVTTSEITVLLASLGILTATFTATGVPDKLGILLMELASFNVLAMVLAAFAFGYLIGMGLPVAPTYIVLAVVTVPFLIRAGFDPWVGHFFAFLVALFGELSPPTSVTAAVTSRIAGASFMRTMWHALALCLPLLTMMGAIFTRPQLVTEAGIAQLGPACLVLVGTLGLVFSLQGHFAVHRAALDHCLRVLMAIGSLVVLFHPSLPLATICAMLVAILAAVGIFRRVPPGLATGEAPATAQSSRS